MMRDVTESVTPEDDVIEVFEDEKKLAVIVYALQALSLFIAFASIPGVIINYLKISETKSDVIRAHFSYQIRTFWWALVVGIIGAILTTIGVGFFILIGLWIWYVYRVVKGFIRIGDGRLV